MKRKINFQKLGSEKEPRGLYPTFLKWPPTVKVQFLQELEIQVIFENWTEIGRYHAIIQFTREKQKKFNRSDNNHLNRDN